MKVSIVIPARWGSGRLPGKVMADIGGWPMLWHTWNRVQEVAGVDEVVVAADDEGIYGAVKEWGGKVVMTDERYQCGTDRICGILDQLGGDLIINVQADECFIDKGIVGELIEGYGKGGSDVVTPVFRITEVRQLLDVNLVKAVVGRDGRAVYFSREAVPHMRGEEKENWLEKRNYWGHVGVYGYSREILEEYGKYGFGDLEGCERLEQLRFLEMGSRVRVFETNYHKLAVDTEEDLESARALIREESKL